MIEGGKFNDNPADSYPLVGDAACLEESGSPCDLPRGAWPLTSTVPLLSFCRFTP